MRAPAHSPAPRAPLLLSLALLAVFAAAVTATGLLPPHYQTYVICKQPSHLCVAWLAATALVREEWDLSPADICGLLHPSDIEAPPATYTIKALDNGEVRNVFCDAVIINDDTEVTEVGAARVRRQAAGTPRGRYRGQTQSQYLAVDRDGKDEGKAEAHSAADSSRASVSGNSGMGQAQSQSMYEPSCEDCYGGAEPETNGFRGYSQGQNGGPGWIGVHNSGRPVGNSYMNNQNARPALENYGRTQPSSPGYERGYSVPIVANGLTPGGVVGPTQGQNKDFFPGSSGTRFRQGEPQGSYLPGLGDSTTQYGPNQQGNGGYGSNHQGGPKLGNRYAPLGSDSIGYGPGQDGIPGGGGNYPPGSLMSAPGQGGSGPAPLGGITSNGALLPNQIGVPGQVYNQMQNRSPGYRPGGSTPGVYGPSQSSSLTPNVNTGPLEGGSTPGVYGPGQGSSHTPNVNTGPLQSGSNNGIPGNQGQSGVYNPKETSAPNGSGDVTTGDMNPQGNINSNQGGIPGYLPDQGSAGNNLNPVQGGNWPITSYNSGGSPYFCCVVGPDGKIIPAGRSPFNIGTSNQYPNLNNQYGYGGQIPGSTDQSKISNIPGQGPYGISGSGNGGISLGKGQGNNYGPGPGNYMLGTGRVPQGGRSDQGTMSGSGNYGPSRNVDRFDPEITGRGGSFTPNLIGTDQTRPGGGSIPMGGMGYPTSQALGPNMPNAGIGYGPVVSGGPGSGGYNPIGGIAEPKQYLPGQLGIPGSENNYAHGQGGTPMTNRNYASGSPVDGGSYIPGQDNRPSTSGNFGPGRVNNLGGENYGPSQVSEPENIRSYEPGQNVGGGGYRVSPNDGTGFYNYGPHQIGGPGGASHNGGSYEPGQINGMGGNIKPNLNRHPASSGNFGDGQNVGPGNIGLGNYGPGQNGGSGGYIPGTSNMGNYGPSGAGPGQSGPGGAGPYGPYQGASIGDQGSNPPGQTDVRGMGSYQPGQLGYGSLGVPGQSGIDGVGSSLPGQGGKPGEGYGSVEVPGQSGIGGVGSYQPGQGGKLGEGYDSVGVPGNGGRYDNRQPIYGTDFTNRYGSGPGRNGYNARYPGQNNEYSGVPQNFTDVGNLADGDDSEAEASVSQVANGTTASATSRGGNDKGRAQTNVQGTYTGSGSFSAQAQITGENKEAESQVTGGKKGASSSAQGSGRNNKSQANVQLGSETGSVQTQSLTSGAYHSSNSQVQGSVKGGMADAQARGPGSTSSQAQIGFTPYKDGDKSHDTQKIPFMGGGVASAQSSGRTGQSQSQLHGTFKYGITYNGAAQAGASVDKDAVFPNRLTFDKIDVFDEKEKHINVDTEKPNELDTPAPVDTTPSLELVPSEESLPPLDESATEGGMTAIDTGDRADTGDTGDTEDKTVKDDETLKNSETRYSSHTHQDHHKVNGAAAGVTRSFQSRYGNNGGEYEYTTDREDVPTDEYDTDGAEEDQGEYSNYDDIPRDPQTHQSLQAPRKTLDVRQTTGGNTQHIVLGSLGGHDAEITQKSSERPDEGRTYQPGERVPGTGGYTIPTGFTGSVKSVASKEKTYVVGSRESPSQAQTVRLTAGSGRVRYAPPAGRGRVGAGQLRSLARPRDDRYVSVSKSVARDLDADDHVRKQYSHSYYTKSSSCGFFTFTCTMVSGAEGNKKVCRPKIPTNPDGTPIKC